MGSLSNESFEQFLDSLKKAGIVISNILLEPSCAPAPA